MRKIITAGVAALFLCLLSLPSFAVTLDKESACLGMGGSWTQITQPPRVGHCDLKWSYTVPAGDILELVSAVSLNIENYATLRVNGRLAVSNGALLEFRHAYLENYNEVQISSGAKVKLWAGAIRNYGEYVNDGLLGNGWQPGLERGVFNSGLFSNTNDGHVDNNGVFVNQYDGRFVSFAGAQFVNYYGASFTANNDLHEGYFENDKHADIFVRGPLRLEAGGLVTNRGRVSLYAGQITIDAGGQFYNEAGGRFFVDTMRNVTINGEFTSDNARIDNYGLISLGQAQSLLRTIDGGIYNAPSGVIDANKGKFSLSCTIFTNKGAVYGAYFDNCTSKYPTK
ncbi:MAG: hypothetical protein K0U72_11985 [Gammaproteobacteria bacterium]|nr:hypothetical protein [Gammaproteobacteria bacterium]